ncbi:MAG: hypothetical protein U0414_22760 [Polyangiaceae bacterium]
MRPHPELDPSSLATMLDRWALRREKVLEVLDIRAATKARELARACDDFAVWRERADVTELEAHFVWVELRQRVAELLAEAHGDTPSPSSGRASVSGTRAAATPSITGAASRRGAASSER